MSEHRTVGTLIERIVDLEQRLASAEASLTEYEEAIKRWCHLETVAHEECEKLRQRLASAEALLTRLVQCWGPHDIAHYKAVAEHNGTEHHREMIRILEAAKGGRDE